MVMARYLSTCAALTALGLAGCLSPTDPGALVPPTADQDPNLPQIELHVAGNARAIHIETYGDPSNPSLFLLHGSLSDFRALRPFQVLAGEVAAQVQRLHVGGGQLLLVLVLLVGGAPAASRGAARPGASRGCRCRRCQPCLILAG